MLELSEEQAEILAVAVARDEAHAVLWHYEGTRRGVMEPGDFRKALIEAMVRADPLNLRRLAFGFPGLAAAVQLVQGRETGIARLRQVAGIDEQPDKSDKSEQPAST